MQHPPQLYAEDHVILLGDPTLNADDNVENDFTSYSMLPALPDDVFRYLFSFVSVKDLFLAGCVCLEWRRISSYPILWDPFFKERNEEVRKHLFYNAYAGFSGTRSVWPTTTTESWFRDREHLATGRSLIAMRISALDEAEREKAEKEMAERRRLKVARCYEHWHPRIRAFVSYGTFILIGLSLFMSLFSKLPNIATIICLLLSLLLITLFLIWRYVASCLITRKYNTLTCFKWGDMFAFLLGLNVSAAFVSAKAVGSSPFHTWSWLQTLLPFLVCSVLCSLMCCVAPFIKKIHRARVQQFVRDIVDPQKLSGFMMSTLVMLVATFVLLFGLRLSDLSVSWPVVFIPIWIFDGILLCLAVFACGFGESRWIGFVLILFVVGTIDFCLLLVGFNAVVTFVAFILIAMAVLCAYHRHVKGTSTEFRFG